MTPDERFAYYIKSWTQKATVKVPECAKMFKQNCLVHYTGPGTPAPAGYPRNASWQRGFWWNLMLLDIPCLSISADGIDSHGLPVIAKVRRIDDPKGAILAPLAWIRHWGLVEKAKSADIPWERKTNTCVWRGAATGIQDSGRKPGEWQNKRMAFCHRWKNEHDVGINRALGRWDVSYVKPTLTLHEILSHKYVLSIPGNDKDSGLNWKLASNSVVLMAPPTIESWLMEGCLRPYVHYIPLKADYSDLNEIITWCDANPIKCQEVVENASRFMAQFADTAIERDIFDRIKRHYSSSFTLIRTA